MEKGSIILQAQKEVQGHTHEFLVQPILAIFDAVYHDVMKEDGGLTSFQKQLRQVPAWSQLQVDKVVQSIEASCNFLSELITALFLSHIKILSSIKINKIPSLRVKVPRHGKFIHAVLIESARQYYEDPFIFRRNDNPSKARVVMNAIESAVRKFLPLKDILNAYLNNKATAIEEKGPDDMELETPIGDDEDIDDDEEERIQGLLGDDEEDVKTTSKQKEKESSDDDDFFGQMTKSPGAMTPLMSVDHGAKTPKAASRHMTPRQTPATVEEKNIVINTVQPPGGGGASSISKHLPPKVQALVDEVLSKDTKAKTFFHDSDIEDEV